MSSEDLKSLRESLELFQGVADSALDALDRVAEAQGLQHTAHTHSVSDRERRYEAALREIAAKWHATIPKPTVFDIARRALGETP